MNYWSWKNNFKNMNPPKETWLSPKIEIRETGDRGRGMFALEKINKGEKILIWGGEYVNEVEARKAEAEGKLVMQFDDDLYSIENRGEDIGYFLNHSCEPNVWMDDAFSLSAMNDINVGEEITADYAMWEACEDYISKWQCKCGAKNCRGRVTGKDWELKELQEKYAGHFLPLINKRIKK